MNKAIFFDRDGVLNEEVGYLHEIEKFVWVEGARETIKFCNENNFFAIVITNQGGIAKGLYTERDVKILHNFMQNELKKIGAHIDDFFYCPHHEDGIIPEYTKICDCRKPAPKMILQACEKFNIDKKKSFMIGDRQRDFEAGKNAGLGGSFLFTGGNLFDFVQKIISEGNF